MTIGRRSILITLGLSLLSLLPVSSQTRPAPSASGLWKSDTGNTFRIPASTQAFDIIITTASGQRMIGQGSWVQYPYSFSYTVSGTPGSSVCTFSSRNPNRLKVVGPAGTHYWQRVSY